MDLSGTGIRLRCAGKPTLEVGQIVSITLEAPQSRLTLRGRVVRVKKHGFRSKTHEVAFDFMDMRPQLANSIHSLAQFGFVPRTETVDATRLPPVNPAPKELPDHYGVLGLTQSATAEQIHEAYRVRARQYHPDVNRSPEAATIFDALTKAYRALRDAESRQSYDIQLSMRA